MTKRVQLAGGSFDVEGFLVGFQRELRVDLDNDSLRLHDGVKEGGFEFLNRDANDNRYQFHSAELDGFKFGSQEKGLLVRTGPAQYKIRKLISTSGDLDYGATFRGTPGDFDLNLAATIQSAHTWSATQTFAVRIEAEDGVHGDTYGTHHGNVVGNVTGNLTGNAAGDHTGSFTGDVDVRGHTILFDPGQIQEEALDPSILVNRGVPMGAIIMWSGTIATIPESWALCDGSNGTPDLRGKFIRGAGTGTGIPAPLSSGGNASVSLTGTIAAGGSHSHPLSIDGHALTIDEMPAHTHTTPCGPREGDTTTNFTNGNNSVGPPVATNSAGGGNPHTHTGATTDSGSHTHDLTLDAVTFMPPYYALCYIMKIV